MSVRTINRVAVTIRTLSVLLALQALLLSSTWPPAAIAGTATQEDLRQIYERANALIVANKPAEAIPMLEKAVALAPNSTTMHNTLGVAYQNSGKTEQAFIEYKKVLALEPNSRAVCLNIAHCYVNLNQYATAITWYDTYLRDSTHIPDREKIESERKEILLRKYTTDGDALLKSGKNLDARKSFQNAVATKPDSAYAHMKLASSLNLCGEPQQAIAEFRKTLILDPKMADATYNIAVCYQNLGDIDQAIEWYDRFAQEAPNSPLSPSIPNKIEALHKASKEYRTDPNSPDYLDSIMNNQKYYRWPHEMVPIRIYIEPPTNVEGYREAFGKAFLEALVIWANASENRLAFLLVPDKSQANVTCEWVSEPMKVSDEGLAVEQGWTKVHGNTTGTGVVLINSAVIRILTKSRKGTRDLVNDDIKKASLHEIGHMLGLNGHSSNNHDVMFFSESPSVWPALSKRDKTTILRLYGMYPQRPDIPPVATME